MKDFILVDLPVEDLNLIEKVSSIEDPGKLNCRMLQTIWSKIENKKFLSNCFCSSSTRKTFKKMFFEMYNEYQQFKNDKNTTR